MTKPNRKFCSDDCKNEYNRFGAAYGPLKDKLTKLIEQRVREATRAAFQQATAAMAAIEHHAGLLIGTTLRIENLAKRLDTLENFPPPDAEHGKAAARTGRSRG